MSQGRMIQLEQDILSKNNAYAADNRAFFADHGILALNLVSSPGSGKTSLLVKTIELLKDKLAASVIEGDQQTSADAERVTLLWAVLRKLAGAEDVTEALLEAVRPPE